MTALTDAVADMIEPDAKDLVGEASDEVAALASLAISLRRIADVMQGDETRGDFLQQLFGVLGDASHNHAQRMR